MMSIYDSLQKYHKNFYFYRKIGRRLTQMHADFFDKMKNPENLSLNTKSTRFSSRFAYYYFCVASKSCAKNSRIRKIFFALACFILFLASPVYSDLSLSIVKPKGFTKKIYSDEVSRYRVISNDREFALPDTPFQKMLKSHKRNNSRTLIIHSGRGAGRASRPLREHVAETRLADFRDNRIGALKKRFKASESIIDDVERFVCRHINKKTIGIPLASATHIMDSRTGDCTEHTVLAVAILRSLGIPARAIVGMLLSEEFGGYRNVFVYHMWAEAYVKGKWIFVDATRPGVKHPNRYIAFSYHHLKTEMPLPYLKAISAMKNFSVEYLGE